LSALARLLIARDSAKGGAMATTDSNTEALEWLQKLQPNRDPYEYLVQRKFPGYKAVQYAPISLGNIGRSGISHDDRREKLLKEVESFRAELKAKPLREIKTLYEQEQEKERQALAAKAEREEQQRFFNRPDANADFIHWAKMTYWTLDEALALTFGKSPLTLHKFSLFSDFRRLSVLASNATARRGRLGLRRD